MTIFEELQVRLEKYEAEHYWNCDEPWEFRQGRVQELTDIIQLIKSAHILESVEDEP